MENEQAAVSCSTGFCVCGGGTGWLTGLVV
jgi:hypothetical protein